MERKFASLRKHLFVEFLYSDCFHLDFGVAALFGLRSSVIFRGLEEYPKTCNK